MEYMGLRDIYPEHQTTIEIKEHRKYPNLLKKFMNEIALIIIKNCNRVWSTDITYIRIVKGFMCLAVIIDWQTKLFFL